MVPVTDPLAVPVPRPPERDVDEYGYLTQWTSDGIDILPRVPDWDSLVGLVDDMSKDTFWNSNTYFGLRARAMVYGTERKRPREKRPNDEKLQKKERKAARLTPEEVDSIISRILSELHTVPFKEVLLSENADIPDVYFWAFLNEEWAKGFTVVDGAGYQHGVWPDLSGVMVRREPRPDSTENERDTFYAGFGRRNNHINGELFAQTINDCPEETRAGGDFLPLDTDPGRDTSYHIFMTPLLFTNTDFLATAYCKTIQEHGRHAPHIFAVAAHILGGPAPFGQTADLTEELTVEDGHRPEELPEPPPVEELEGIPTRDPPPVHPATTTKKYMHVLGEVHMPYVLLGDSGLEAFLRRVPYMRPFLMKMHVRWSNFSRALSRVLRYGVGPGTYPYRAGAPGHGELSQHNRAGLPFRSFLITAADEFHPANKYADYFDCIYDEDNHAHLRDSASRQDVERCFYEIAMPDDLNAPPMTLTPANADLCGPRIVRFTHVAPAGPSRGAPNTIQNRSHITIFDANNRNTWQQIIAGTRKPPNEAAGPHPCGPDPKYFPVSVNDYTGPGGVVVSLRRRGPTGTAPATPPVVHQVLGFPLSVHTWVYGIAAYLAAAVKLHGALSFFLEPLPGELGNIIIDYVRSHEDELQFRFTASGEVARSAKLDKWYEVEYPDCERVDPAHLITAFESLLHKATNDWLAVQIKHETPPAAREDVDMDRNHCWPVAFRLPDGVINALNAQVRGADFDPTNDPSHPHRPSVYDVNASAVRNAIMDFEQRYADIHEQFRHAEYGNFTFDPFYNEFGAAIFSREPQARALLHGWLEQFVYNHATVDAATRRPITFTSREAYRAVQIVDVLPLRHSLGDPDNDSLLRQIPHIYIGHGPHGAPVDPYEGRTRFTNIMNYITTTKAEESRAYIWDPRLDGKIKLVGTDEYIRRNPGIARKPFVRPFVVWSTDFKDLRTNEPTGLARFGHIQAGTEVDAINEIHYGWPSNRHLNKLANADCKPILGVGYFSATMRNHRPPLRLSAAPCRARPFAATVVPRLRSTRSYPCPLFGTEPRRSGADGDNPARR
eukprot:tig00021332_g20320.t1